MTQTELPFFALPSNPYRPLTQCYALYEWLEANGQITLHEIHHVLKQDTARVRVDVKRFLRRNGFEVECLRRGQDSVYRVRRG